MCGALSCAVKKGAKIGFVFPQAWLLHPLQKGRYLHVLSEIVQMAAAGKMTVNNINKYSLNKIATARDAVSKFDGSVVVNIKSK